MWVHTTRAAYHVGYISHVPRSHYPSCTPTAPHMEISAASDRRVTFPSLEQPSPRPPRATYLLNVKEKKLGHSRESSSSGTRPSLLILPRFYHDIGSWLSLDIQILFSPNPFANSVRIVCFPVPITDTMRLHYLFSISVVRSSNPGRTL